MMCAVWQGQLLPGHSNVCLGVFRKGPETQGLVMWCCATCDGYECMALAAICTGVVKTETSSQREASQRESEHDRASSREGALERVSKRERKRASASDRARARGRERESASERARARERE
jgi:hypothetical protein